MPHKKWWEYATILGASGIPPANVPKDFAKTEVASCKKLGADTFFIFVERNGEYIWPSAYGPIHPACRKRDILRELVTECKEKEIRFVAAFMGMHVQYHLARKHPTLSITFRSGHST